MKKGKSKYCVLILLSLHILLSSSYGQSNEYVTLSNDSIESKDCKFSYKQLILPSTLMAYGIAESVLVPNLKLLNYGIAHEVANHMPEKFQIDDITQYVPAVSVYVLNLAGVEDKHNFKDRTIILGMASIFTAASVNTIKYTARVERPDKSARNSFPSGHTAIAFMGAEFLWQEYKDVSPWYGIAGYTIATGTGAFRMYNNKHWFGDVAFGAGVGILSTKMAYWLYPAVDRKFINKGNCKSNGKKVESFAFSPYYNGSQGGLSVMVGW